MRAVKSPEERREEILGAAIRVFAGKGYDKTTISDIAKEIGISQGLCYRYYQSKEEIYDEALENYADYIVQENLKRYQLQGKTFKEMILGVSGHVSDYADAERGQSELYAMFHSGENRKLHDQLFARIAGKLVPYITQFITQANQTGEIHISDPETMAYFVIYGQMGILMNPNMPKEDCQKRIQQSLLEMFHLN